MSMLFRPLNTPVPLPCPRLSGITAQRISILLDEADVEASTPAEEAALKELNRILGNWFRAPGMDHQACFQALKTNLKARNGATPEACK
jgi:hypothetical protein